MSKKVFKWTGPTYYGRIEGVFVATDAEIARISNLQADLGEALGKHSHVQIELAPEQFKAISEDPVIVTFVEEHGPFGRNPNDYIAIPCDECENLMRVTEEQDYWCKTCETRICYSCTKDVDHEQGCEIVEYEGQAATIEEE
jgi:hypothetical protein